MVMNDMQDDGKWGAAIPIMDGKRPEWLDVHETYEDTEMRRVSTDNGETPENWYWPPIKSIRLPADHPHYRQGQAVDWSKPIEAVHEDGQVVPVTAKGGAYSGGAYQDIEQELGEHRNFSFKIDGTHPTKCGWRIRNVQPATQAPDAQTLTAQERLERMEAFVRKAAAHVGPMAQYSAVRDHLGDEARALVAAMEPVVDGDWAEAKRLTAEEYPNAASWNEHALWNMTHIGIKRGRALAEGEGK